jgi:hypothetical protein
MTNKEWMESQGVAIVAAPFVLEEAGWVWERR